jgi:beta-lactamase regulating signal transducer with metallopeptidase domain
MDPKLGLLAASGLVSFLLKTTVEWLVCLMLVRIAGSAKIRFSLWLAMLLGFVVQWVWMWTGVVRAAFASASGFHAEAHAGGSAAGAVAAGTPVAVGAGIAADAARAMAVLLVCYGSMLAWRMVGALAARVRLARAMRHKTAPQQRLVASFQEALEQAAVDGYRLRDCELWVLPGLASPATLGWWQPRVIVPPVCETQDAAELKMVFWHELKHVDRCDALWNAIVRSCRNLLWFHPCMHHATLALNAERELACDAAVVREHPQSRDVYATCLVRFARIRDLATERTATGIEMASGAALLSTRVQSILSETQRASRVSRAWRATVGMLLVGVMVASVRALNILFAAEVSAPAMQIPIALDAHAAGPRHAVKYLGTKMQGSGSLAVTGVAEPSGLARLALQHDEGLAAEHRAAMDIVTESTGMDAASAGNEVGISQNVSGPALAHGTPLQSPTSWTSVAVDAAERMAPLMNDHDADDRH